MEFLASLIKDGLDIVYKFSTLILLSLTLWRICEIRHLAREALRIVEVRLKFRKRRRTTKTQGREEMRVEQAGKGD